MKCACKGIRTCNICETPDIKSKIVSNEKHKFKDLATQKCYLYCGDCKKAYRYTPSVTDDDDDQSEALSRLALDSPGGSCSTHSTPSTTFTTTTSTTTAKPGTTTTAVNTTSNSSTTTTTTSSSTTTSSTTTTTTTTTDPTTTTTDPTTTTSTTTTTTTTDPTTTTTTTTTDPTDYLQVEGLSLHNDYVTEQEAADLVACIDNTKWVESQSGRRKQDYGPKVNFKKRKLRLANFTGLPDYSKPLVERLSKVTDDFRPVELCCLDYQRKWGSSIDPHYDDQWIWGERLVTLNLLTPTYHTLTNDLLPGVEIHVRLAPNTLIICSGEARYAWRHGIRREHIADRRMALTFRELPPSYLEGGEQWDTGRLLLDTSLGYGGRAQVT